MMTPLRILLLAALLAGVAAVLWLAWPARTEVVLVARSPAQEASAVERGAYLVKAASCVSCHWNRKGGGQPFAGGRGLETPFGTFYTPNITPDRDTGIGSWSEEDFVRALTAGEGIHGEALYPVFPYTSYSTMSVDDARDIRAYLFSLPAVKSVPPANVVSFPFSWRGLLKGWKLLFFAGPGALADDATRDTTWNRGRYLVTALGHCGECHSPRNALGAPDKSAFLRGNRHGPDGWAVPALVGGANRDFDQWSVEEIATYLKSGATPDFDSAQGPMAEVIEDSTRFLTDGDRRAIALYLKSLNTR